MTTLTFTDGATFCDGAGFTTRLRRFVRIFFDVAAPARITCLKAYRYDHPALDLSAAYTEYPGGQPVQLERRSIEIEARSVRRAEPCAMAGRPGYLLYKAGRKPVAWCTAADWEAAQ